MNMLDNNHLLLAIDVGNTHTVVVVFEGEEIVARLRLSTNRSRTVDEYIIFLSSFLASHGISADMITHSVICNVVPEIGYLLKEICYRFLGNEPLIVGESDTYLGIEIYKKEIKEAVSPNIIANCVGAKEKYGRDLIVVDFGSVTTFNVIDQHGIYIGSVVAPGLKSSLQLLSSNNILFYDIEVTNPQKIIGENLEEAIKSGIYYGYAGLVKEIVGRINRAHGKKRVIATGDVSIILKEISDIINYFESDLTLLGLQKIFRINNDYKVIQYAN
jgi:type III pantothenate kinase